MLVNAASECTRLIVVAKEKNLIRLSTKIEDPSTAPKTYWSILNRFLIRKYPLPHLSNFAKNVELFNSYFSSQYTTVIKKSQLPSLELKTSKSITKITFTDDDIDLIIKNLNVDKAQ